MADIINTIKTRRSIRRYKQQPLTTGILEELIDTARYAPSAANLQPLEYVIVNDDKQVVDDVFSCLAWAAYLTEKRLPPAGQYPVAYIIVLTDTKKRLGQFGSIDAGAAIQNILLAAWSKGIGSCWLGSVSKDKLRKILSIPERYEVDSVIALGYPAEEPIAEDCTSDSVRYYLDPNDRLHVPKRPLQKILHINKFGKK